MSFSNSDLSLAREMRFEMTNLKEFNLENESESKFLLLHLRFATAMGGAFYYHGYVYELGGRFDSSIPPSFYVRVVGNKEKQLEFTLITTNYKAVPQRAGSKKTYHLGYEVKAVGSKSVDRGDALQVRGMKKIIFLKKKAKDGGGIFTLEEEDTFIPYWIKYIRNNKSSKNLKLELKSKTVLVSKKEEKQALGNLTARGPIEFFRGDGCEKGNLFFLTNEDSKADSVNVVALDFYKYYVPEDYATLPSLLLRKLFMRDSYDIESGEDTKLNGPNIPFTFVGQVTTHVTDLLEGNTWWVARKNEGLLYLGREVSEKLEVVTVLNKVLGAAKELGMNGEEFTDVQYAKGSEDILTFKFKNGNEILVDLKTGRVWNEPVL